MVWFLTFRSYGSYSVEPTKLAEWRREHMRSEEFEFAKEHRATVLTAIECVCRTRGWELLAVHVRATHVHAVVGGDAEPDQMIRDFKAYSTRALRAAGFVNANARIWAKGGYWRWLISPPRIRAAIRYVLDRQGKLMAAHDGTL